MHVIQSFTGCIAKLMKSSGLEVYVAAAYTGLVIHLIKGNITIISNNNFYRFTGIFNGKSWVKAIRGFSGVSAALLKRFLYTGLKTFEQIEQYLDTACLHPTGRHWVNNFFHTPRKS